MADFAVTELDSGIDFSTLPYWDVVIVGAGPAGLAAGLTTAHRGLTTLVVEAKNRPGGQPQFLYADKKIVDVPGFPDGVTGEELSARVFRQAEDALVQFRFHEELVAIEDTERVEKDDPLKRLVTNGGGYVCRKVIIACGLLHYPRKLPVLDQLSSKKVYYKIPKIVLTVSDGTDVECDLAIVQIGFLSAKETFQRLDLRLNHNGSIAIDPYYETSRRGIFAVGDVHGDVKLITVAWAEGIQAAIYAFKEITSPYWLNEKRLRDQKITMIGEKITQAAQSQTLAKRKRT